MTKSSSPPHLSLETRERVATLSSIGGLVTAFSLVITAIAALAGVFTPDTTTADLAAKEASRVATSLDRYVTLHEKEHELQEREFAARKREVDARIDALQKQTDDLSKDEE